jgi:hypothetical protein
MLFSSGLLRPDWALWKEKFERSFQVPSGVPPFWPASVAFSRAWISERASMMVTLKRCLGSR